MAKRKGGWVQPWTTLHYVKSNVHASLCSLTSQLGWNEASLLTEEEQDLLNSLSRAEMLCEILLKDGDGS